MRKYIYHFDTESDFNEMRSAENYDEPWLSLTEYNLDENIPVTDEEIPDVARVDYNKTEREKERERLLETPMTFEIQSDGNIIWKASDTGNTITIEYSKDNGETWTEITSATGDTAPSISVVSGDTIQFRGDNSTYAPNNYYNSFENTTCGFSVKGNIMSLISSTDFKDISVISSRYCFITLFYNCTGLTDASKLLLPATTLGDYCYESMFQGCTNLTTAPELPATTLAGNCYYHMFDGCTNLTQAPELPATTLAEYCYGYMFGGCTNLTSVPVNYLPVTTLAQNCYFGMFQGCTNLTTAPELPATTLAFGCYYSMFRGCTSLVNAPALPATTLANYCYYQMFYGCTSLTQAPELPATTLTSSCYSSMLQNCTNLNYIKCSATDISANSCTNNWVRGVASSGTFVTPSSTNWSTGASGIPSGWTVQDAS